MGPAISTLPWPSSLDSEGTARAAAAPLPLLPTRRDVSDHAWGVPQHFLKEQLRWCFLSLPVLVNFFFLTSWLAVVHYKLGLEKLLVW